MEKGTKNIPVARSDPTNRLYPARSIKLTIGFSKKYNVTERINGMKRLVVTMIKLNTVRNAIDRKSNWRFALFLRMFCRFAKLLILDTRHLNGGLRGKLRKSIGCSL